MGGGWDSNPRPPGPQPGALPAELPPPRSGHRSHGVRAGGPRTAAPARAGRPLPGCGFPVPGRRLSADAIVRAARRSYVRPDDAPRREEETMSSIALPTRTARREVAAPAPVLEEHRWLALLLPTFGAGSSFSALVLGPIAMMFAFIYLCISSDSNGETASPLHVQRTFSAIERKSFASAR